MNGAETLLPVSIQVHNLTGNSAIFVGKQNIASGYSTHSKTNAGFGSIASRNHVMNNITFVYDPDWIDTPIDDRDVHVLTPQPTGAGVGDFRVGVHSVNVATMNQNSGVFLGTANITGFESHQKANLGFGHTYGDWNQQARNRNVAYDPDWIDTPIFDQDNKQGVFWSR